MASGPALCPSDRSLSFVGCPLTIVRSERFLHPHRVLVRQRVVPGHGADLRVPGGAVERERGVVRCRDLEARDADVPGAQAVLERGEQRARVAATTLVRVDVDREEVSDATSFLDHGARERSDGAVEDDAEVHRVRSRKRVAVFGHMVRASRREARPLEREQGG